MRRWPGLLLVLIVASCGDGPADPATLPESVERRERPPRRPRTEPEDLTDEGESPPDTPEAGARSLFRDLADPASREGAEQRLDDLPDARRIELLRRGLWLDLELAMEAAKRLEHQVLDADESERFVGLLLPHLFDESEDIDFEELRSALGSNEIEGVLQEMREHASIAGERSLLGALHRQLRAEHLPALVEMALSPDRALAEQAFEEIAIVAAHTNQHRETVAEKIFAGRASQPRETGAIPPALVVAWRAIIDGEWRIESHRTMFVLWALRWLRDVTPSGPADAELLVELFTTAQRAADRGEWESDTAQLYAIVELQALAPERLAEPTVANAEHSEDVATALRVAALARSEGAEAAALRSLAVADPLALALMLEMDPFRGPVALFAALGSREPEKALDFVDDVYRHRFRLRLAWDRLPSLGMQPPLGDGLDPALVLRLSARFREIRGSHALEPFLSRISRSGGLSRSGSGDLHDAVFPSVEGRRLREVLRHILTNGEPDDGEAAGELLAALRDVESEEALLAGVESELLGPGVLEDVAEWASESGRARIRGLLEVSGGQHELTTLAALGGVPRRVAEPFGWRAYKRVLHSAEGADEVVRMLRAGDAIGALLHHLDVDRHIELEGVGAIDDPRVRIWLLAWSQRREDGRTRWALGELALSGDEDAVRQIREVVDVGRYRWVDDASAEVLFIGGGGTLGFWVREAESNCCRAVPVMRVFEEYLRIAATEEMAFQTGEGVTLGEWLRWRLGQAVWMTPAASSLKIGAPETVRALQWSDIEDGYVPSVR